MKILFATNHLWNYTGSELNLIGLARAMAARGHEVACHALVVSPDLRAGLQERGLRLLPDDDEALAQFAPDAVFCQHHSAAASVRGRLPRTPMALAHLGVEPELEQAPLVDCGAGVHLAISEEVRETLIAQGVPAGRIRIFRNAIDPTLYPLRQGSAAQEGAMLFSYKMSADAAALVASVTQEFGLPLDTGSLTTHGVQQPAAIAARLGAARLVLASGRSALEAALAGAAVVVLGPKGLDGALTPSSWRGLAHANFSGRNRALPLTADDLREAIANALQSDPVALRTELEEAFGLQRRAQELETLLPKLPVSALCEREVALNRRLSRLLHEQRLQAMLQRDVEKELERQREHRNAPWWWRLLLRVGTVLHRVATS